MGIPILANQQRISWFFSISSYYLILLYTSYTHTHNVPSEYLYTQCWPRSHADINSQATSKLSVTTDSVSTPRSRPMSSGLCTSYVLRRVIYSKAKLIDRHPATSSLDRGLSTSVLRRKISDPSLCMTRTPTLFSTLPLPSSPLSSYSPTLSERGS